ncbi:MAG: DUF4124 domain-containing protein [Nitrososphaera sp.]
MKKWKPFLVALVSFVTAAFGAVYTWTDDKGNVHYSDKPPGERKAKEVKLPSQVSPAPAEIEKARQGIENRQEIPERWVFTFDSGAWHVGYQETDGQQAIREYVLQGETVHNWRKLVTSLYVNVDLTPKEFFQRLTQKGAEGCPSLKISVVEETQDMLIFEWGHNGCHAHPPQHEIRRISRSKPGILSLSFAEKGPLSTENRNTWLSILRNAVVVKLPDKEQGRKSQPESRSLPLSALGPLPSNESSEYVETFGTSILFDTQTPVGQFGITLKAKQRLPFGAYLEAHFEDPANPNNQIVVGKVRQGAEEKVVILSPKLKGIKCWNYEVAVNVYRGSSKSKLLGTHHQRIQSRVNSDKIKTAKDLLGTCP